MAYLCDYYHCRELATIGCNYCNKHSCRNVECNNNNKCPVHVYDICKFDMDICREPCTKSSNYCMNHKCTFPGCPSVKTANDATHNRERELTSGWCNLHKCGESSGVCANIAFTPGSYCELHLCKWKGGVDISRCKNERIDGKLYCDKHACIICDNVCIMGTIYCVTHKCSRCDEYVICKFHTCCTCYRDKLKCICETATANKSLTDKCSVCFSTSIEDSKDSTLCLYHKCKLPECNNVSMSVNTRLCKLHKCPDCDSPYKCIFHYHIILERLVRNIQMPKDIHNIILEYVFRDKFPFDNIKRVKDIKIFDRGAISVIYRGHGHYSEYWPTLPGEVLLNTFRSKRFIF